MSVQIRSAARTAWIQLPAEYISMGGMFTILNVRAGITTYDDPGWYVRPRERSRKPQPNRN